MEIAALALAAAERIDWKQEEAEKEAAERARKEREACA